MSSLILLVFSLSCTTVLAQEIPSISSVVFLDSFVVTAQRADFNTDDFIALVQEDDSFYEAFLNLRYLNYSSSNIISIKDKNGIAAAGYIAQTKQQMTGDSCREVHILEEQIEGNYYQRKRKPRYYTARMYERLFFTTEGQVCEDDESTSKGLIETRVDALKRLIFQPGKRVQVPFIADKTAIFSKKMQVYYDYAITSKLYDDTIDCYVFSVQAKPDFKEGKTVIKQLATYFDKSTFQVVARQYHLKYAGTAFDFDVRMNIELGKLGIRYIPTYLDYEGFWKIPTQKAERVQFETTFYDFQGIE
ncbi:MAG: hypothetical protein AAF738_06825 [Bacteroidota bacterium]